MVNPQLMKVQKIIGYHKARVGVGKWLFDSIKKPFTHPYKPNCRVTEKVISYNEILRFAQNDKATVG